MFNFIALCFTTAGGSINFDWQISPHQSLWAGAFQNTIVMWRQRMINVDRFWLWCRSSTWQGELYRRDIYSSLSLHRQSRDVRLPTDKGCIFGLDNRWRWIILRYVLSLKSFLYHMLTIMQSKHQSNVIIFPPEASLAPNLSRNCKMWRINTETVGLHKITGSRLL